MKLKKTEILVLRNVKADMTSHEGFKWPEKGVVTAPDWEDTFTCGHGLHGLPWGVGSTSYFYGYKDAKWLVVKVNTASGYKAGEDELSDKCKFKSGDVIFCGTREIAVALIQKYAPINSVINYATQTAGDCSTQKAGDCSTQKAGDESTQTAGNCSTQTAGNWSTQTAGNCSTQTAGYKSTQTAGNESTQTAGYKSTQTAGNESTQTAGNCSTQKAGDRSVQIVRWYDDKKWTVSTRVITEIEANKPYKFENGKWTLITN